MQICETEWQIKTQVHKKDGTDSFYGYLKAVQNGKVLVDKFYNSREHFQAALNEIASTVEYMEG